MLWFPQLLRSRRVAGASGVVGSANSSAILGGGHWQQRGMGNEWRRKQDHYAKAAKRDGLRSRASFKLQQMNEKVKLLRPGMSVVDLGASPGGWTTVAVQLVNCDRRTPWDHRPPPKDLALKKVGTVVCCDLLDLECVPGATFVQGDFLLEEVRHEVMARLPEGMADIVLSDMAPNTSGHGEMDHFRILELCEMALTFARGGILRPGGTILVKLFNGKGMQGFRDDLRSSFAAVKILKPDASRSESSEMYLCGTGFKPADVVK